MIQIDKTTAANFAAAAATETYNIHELAVILKTSASIIRQRIKAGTVPLPLYDGRAEREWTKAQLTAAGITAVAA